MAPTNTPTPTETLDPFITPTVTPTETVTPLPSWVIVTSPQDGEVLNYGKVYPITWESSPDIVSIYLLIGYQYTCDGCAGGWNTEWVEENPIPNTGFYDWTVYVNDPTNKEFIIAMQGVTSNYEIVGGDLSGVFTVALSDIPTMIITPPAGIPNTATATLTPTITPTFVLSATPTLTYTFTPPSTFTPTPTLTP